MPNLVGDFKKMRIEIPDFCIVVLVGPSGSGKSWLARRLFADDEVLSSDHFRKLVCGAEENQEATDDAFDCLYQVAKKRLNRRKLTVIDATHLNPRARNRALEFARENNCFAIALALNPPVEECQENNAGRLNRQTSRKIVSRQCSEMRQVLKSLKKETFRRVHVLNSRKEAEELEISRIPLWTDKSGLHGPFDIIGDVHGCYDELCALLGKLNYSVNEAEFQAVPPEGRKAVFLGDLCDRGAANMAVLRLVMSMTEAGYALCVPS